MATDLPPWDGIKSLILFKSGATVARLDLRLIPAFQVNVSHKHVNTKLGTTQLYLLMLRQPMRFLPCALERKPST